MKKLTILTLALFLSIAGVTSASEFEGTLSTGVQTGVEGTVIVVPLANPVAGVYTSTQSVSLTATGAPSIHYTVDGSTPTCTSGSTYSGVISVSTSQVIQALSCYPNAQTSGVVIFAYTINLPTPSGGGGGGGGGGVTFTSTPCVSVEYDEWQICINGVQYRNILSQTPNSCFLTVGQQLDGSRACQSATVSGAKITDVMAEEEALTTEIDIKLIKRLAGRILLQVERFGQAWYLDPVSLKRYYLADGDSAYNALRKFGLGIKNVDIAKIPVGQESRFSMTDTDQDGLPDKLEEALGTNPALPDTDKDGVNDGDEVLKNNTNPLGTGKLVYSSSLTSRLKGRIVIQVESRGEAWYINPVDGKRYYLANGEAAYQIMRYLSLGISNKDIRKITVGSWE